MKSQIEDNPLLTEDEAAAYLKVSPRTLQAWRQQGDSGLDFIRLGGKKGGLIRYDKAELDAYRERSKRSHT